MDDLTFSSQIDFRNKLKEILDIIKQSRLRINWRKTKYEGRQIVTGIQLNPSRIIAPKNLYRRGVPNHIQYIRKI